MANVGKYTSPMDAMGYESQLSRIYNFHIPSLRQGLSPVRGLFQQPLGWVVKTGQTLPCYGHQEQGRENNNSDGFILDGENRFIIQMTLIWISSIPKL